MATAPPAFINPNPPYLYMPPPAAPPVQTRSSKSSGLEILKLILGFIIALVLTGILATFLFGPRRDQNENVQESNENIARLDREHELLLEKQRQEHIEKMAEQKRAVDQAAERQRQEFQLFLALEQIRREQDIQQRQLDLMLQAQRQTEEFHKEQQANDNENVLQKFIDEVSSMTPPYNLGRIQLKVHSLLRRLNPEQKSLLISFLYKIGFLSSDGTPETTIDLRGAELKELNVNDVGEDLEFVEILANFSNLALNATNLINATFQKVYLGGASFYSANLTGASFRTSIVIGGNFQHAKLSLSDFSDANAMESRFNDATIQRASFLNTELFDASFERADISMSRFFNAKAVRTRFSSVVGAGTDFYSAQANEADFSSAYMPDAQFKYANLQGASFRGAFIPGANFDAANVYDVDFSRTYLMRANISAGQLDLALSIAYASLPDGSIGKNKNLLRKAAANCTDDSGHVYEWASAGQVTAEQNETTAGCVFQGLSVNATLEQRIDISRYQRLLQEGRARVYIELHSTVTSEYTPLVYATVDFVDASGNPTGPTQTTLNTARFTPPSIFIASVSCPPGTTELRLKLIFSTINAAVQNIYVTLE